MEIIGFIASCLIALWFSGLSGLMAFNNLGQYNIGGVHNTWKVKFGTIVLILATLGLWYLVFEYSPFHLVID